jgi:hypothetical protein
MLAGHESYAKSVSWGDRSSFKLTHLCGSWSHAWQCTRKWCRCLPKCAMGSIHFISLPFLNLDGISTPWDSNCALLKQENTVSWKWWETQFPVQTDSYGVHDDSWQG